MASASRSGFSHQGGGKSTQGRERGFGSTNGGQRSLTPDPSTRVTPAARFLHESLWLYFVPTAEVPPIPGKPLRILLDTNVLIGLEDPKVVPGVYAEMSRLVADSSSKLLYHPDTVADVRRDPDPGRRSVFLSKLDKYLRLDTPPPIDDAWLAASGIAPTPRRLNNLTDAALLRAVEGNAVDLLVTEDQGIHTAAKRVGLGDRVYYVAQCVTMLRHLFGVTMELPPSVTDTPLHGLPLSSAFFDSLRQDYPGFDAWFSTVSRSGRHAWVIRQGEKLAAVCIYKPEDLLVPGRAGTRRGLKLCTFKVGQEHAGNRFGELLLKAAFSYCVLNHIECCYCTVRPDKPELEVFLAKLGFRSLPLPEVPTNERAWVKFIASIPPGMQDTLSNLDFHILASPLYRDDPGVRKFAVPVQPQFHQLLFPDCHLTAAPLLSPEPVGNGIRKAYLCHSRTTRLRPGDLVMFYRSRDWQAFTTLGIIEEAGRFTDPAVLASAVGKRTVYRYSEIERMVVHAAVLAVQFRQIRHFRTRVGLSSLNRRGLAMSHIESIHQVSDEAYRVINSEGA